MKEPQKGYNQQAKHNANKN